MTAWEPSANPPDVQGYAHLPMQLPTEILEPWIESYRSLSVLKTPMFTLWETRPQQDAEPPENYTERETFQWRAERDVDTALWGIADIYLECGWDISSREQQQDSFDRTEFVTRRTRHLQEVARPVIDRISEDGRRYREAHDGEDPQLPDYHFMLYKAIHGNGGSHADFEHWAGRDEL